MYFPSFLVKLNATQKDIVFLLDGSDDARQDFAEMLSFVQKVIEALNVQENKDRVSVVQYSSDPQTHFNLGTYKGEQDVLAAIRHIQHKGGMPLNTGTALDYVRRNVFTESSGSRRHEGVPQILIVLTGGISRDEVLSAATALKLEQVIVFSIGSRNSDILQLQVMAHSPSYALTVPRFNDLVSIYQQLMSFVKRVPRRPKSIPKTALGKGGFYFAFHHLFHPMCSFYGVLQVKTECATYLSTFSFHELAFTDKRESIQRDFVFLLDGSDDVQNAFEAMRGFVQRIVAKFDIDENRDRVALVQYSDDSAVEFYLNTHKSQKEAVNAIQALAHKGGSPLNTGAALQYVRDNVFTVSSGSRHQQGIRQILILLTGGQSSDDVRNAVAHLGEMDVESYALGMMHADATELLSISHEPSHVYFAADLTDLAYMDARLFSTIEMAKVTVTLNVPALSGKSNHILHLIY